MSGIPVYTQSPISADVKPTGVTPAASASSHNAGPQEVQATTTAVPTSTYPPAQPGARPPAPTGTAQQQYIPLQPTPTTSTQSDAPPAPQPGAFPTPQHRNPIPPPPKAGEKYNPPQQTAAPTYYPPQMGIPPPTNAVGSHPPPTSTTNAPSSSYPVSLPTAEKSDQRRSLEHPPGYQQNAYASDLTPDQRRAHEASNNNSGLGLPASSQNRSSFEEESMWDTAKNWAQQAGEKLSAAEAEVWKKINK